MGALFLGLSTCPPKCLCTCLVPWLGGSCQEDLIKYCTVSDFSQFTAKIRCMEYEMGSAYVNLFCLHAEKPLNWKHNLASIPIMHCSYTTEYLLLWGTQCSLVNIHPYETKHHSNTSKPIPTPREIEVLACVSFHVVIRQDETMNGHKLISTNVQKQP